MNTTKSTRKISLSITFTFLLLSSFLLVACGAGSGEGLDQQGQPIKYQRSSSSTSSSTSSIATGPTLAQLQTDIFGSICIRCHVGANAPRGLRLDTEANAYAFLVNVTSQEIPTLLRVDPEKPDNSYIVKKIEGAPDISGGRMPLGGPYLSQEQINQIRSWIANGAPRTGTGIASTKIAKAATEYENGKMNIQLHFSRPVQFELFTPDTIGVIKETNEEEKIIEYFSMLLVDQTLHIGVSNIDKNTTAIKVIIKNDELNQLLDINNQVIDGDEDGHQGGSYVYAYKL